MGEEIGRVIIESRPIGAMVYINGVYKGDTPLDLHHPVGTYTAKLELNGYKTIVIHIKVHTAFPPSEYWETFEE